MPAAVIKRVRHFYPAPLRAIEAIEEECLCAFWRIAQRRKALLMDLMAARFRTPRGLVPGGERLNGTSPRSRHQRRISACWGRIDGLADRGQLTKKGMRWHAGRVFRHSRKSDRTHPRRQTAQVRKRIILRPTCAIE